MLRTILRTASSLGLILCLGFVFTPLGCGGNNEWTVVPSRAANDDPHVPPATFSAVLACANAAQGRLTDRVYRMRFEVEVTESGEENRVKLRDSSPGESTLEACVGHALEGMELPLSVLGRTSMENAVSPASRGLMGQGLEEAIAAINMAPIYLAVAAVAVVVVVGVHYTAKAIDARRLRKRREKCLDMYEICKNERPRSCDHLTDFGLTLCAICRDDCQAAKPYTSSECYQCGFHDLP